MNPYSLPQIFYGYQVELEKLVREISTPLPTRCYLIMGGRSMGKTSFLHQVERKLKEINTKSSPSGYSQIVIPLYLNMLNTPPEEFFSRVADDIVDFCHHIKSLHSILSSSVKTQFASVKTSANPCKAFTYGIYELIQSTSPDKLRVVLLIDNLWRRGREVYDLRANLNALSEEPSLDHALTYVIAGGYHELRELREPYSRGSPLETGVYLDLHVLDKEQSLAFINGPTEDKIPPEIALQVYIETGGHIFLLQYLMSVLCEHEDWVCLSATHVQRAIEDFHSKHRVFERWWARLNKLDRQVHEMLCRFGEVSVDDLLERIPVEPLSLAIDRKLAINEALRTLSTIGLIRERLEGGCYELAGRWPTRWFCQVYGV